MRFLKVNIVLFFTLALFSFSGIGQLTNTYKESHIEVSLRMIGHELLLSAEDSTSRVLPIIWQDSIYGIEFESSFVLSTEDLAEIVKRIAKKNRLAKNYIVEVQSIDSNLVLYSFESNNKTESDIIPCGGRNYPKDHYRILFKIIEPFPNRTNDFPPNVVSEKRASIFPWLILAIAFIGLLFVLIKMKKNKRVKPNATHSLKLGRYQFNKNSGTLDLEGTESQLTHKESALLHLLYLNKNETIERDVLLHEVWGDEGDYVGRTLDVFISKLRKKLEQDETIQISNVRGVGYKLILED